MSPEIIARLTREAEAPEGIAVRVSGPEMKRLLEERAELLAALRDILDHCEDEFDVSWNGGPNWAMRLMDGYGGVAALVVAKADAP